MSRMAGARRLFLVAVTVAVTTAGLLTGLTLAAPPSGADETTVSADTLRTGWDPNEPTLAPASVQASDFGQLFSATVDGAVYGQPLAVGDLVVVTTENASIYGFDKISGALRWSRHFGNPFQAASIGCGDLTPDLGSTSTPVYDPSTGLIYQTTKLADGRDEAHPHWYMQAVRASDGTEAAGFPVTIQGTPANTPGLPFDPFYEMQRPGLLLLDGVVYAGFGAHCDVQPFRGYVVGVGTASHAVTTIWSDESGSGSNAYSEAGIWQSGGGLVSDGPGRIFLTTGNGISPPRGNGDSPPGTLAESVVRLQVAGDGSLSPASFFAPADAPTLDQYDTDLGSGGPVALPDTFGTAAHPHLLVQVGKDGRVFLLDRDHLGGRMQGPGGTDADLSMTGPFNGVWGHPAVYGGQGGYVYTVENQGYLRALAYGTDASGTPVLSSVGTSSGTFGYTSGSPVVTSDGTTPGSALVWVEYSSGPTGAGGQLRAYQAVPTGGLMKQVYSAPLGTVSKFAVPATDGGRVYVGTRDGHVMAFGRPAAPALATTSLNFGQVPVGGSAELTETVTASRDVQVQSITAGGPFTATPPALPQLLHAGDTLTVPVRFAPTAPADATSTLVITSDAGQYGADLHGYGTQKGLLSTPASLDFGQVAVGNGAATLSVNISNTGLRRTTVTGVDLPATPFTVTGAPAAGATLAPQQTVTISITYDPQAQESDSDRLVVHSTSGDVTVPLSGSAVVGHGHLTLTPTTTDFGTQGVGTTTTMTFDVVNTGNIPLTITKAKAPAGVFSTDTPFSEGLTLAPGAVVHQRVQFTPPSRGSFQATYLLSSDDGNGAQLEHLTGVGGTPTLPEVNTWNRNGSATRLGPGVRLTDTGGDETGDAIYQQAVPTNGLRASFTAAIGRGSGADGMAFMLLNPADSSPKSLGAGGSGVGFLGLDGLAVVLDTYANGNDPSSNFVGITSGVQSGDPVWTATSTDIPDLRSGPVQVVVDVYDGRIRVAVAGKIVLRAALPASLADTAFVGYSAGTGGLTDIHYVTSSVVTLGRP